MAKLTRRAFSALAACSLMPPASARAGSGESLALDGYEIVFDSSFDQLRAPAASPPGQRAWNEAGQWTPRYRFTDEPRGCSFDGEYQWYVDPRYDWGPGIGKLHPFAVSDGVLSIIAQRTPAAVLAKLPGRVDADKRDTGIPYPWISGVITTQHSFWYRYGYAEAMIKLPAGRALWPAFWMLPKEWPYPPEVDIMEFIGHDPRKSNFNVIPGTPDKPLPARGEYADRGKDLSLDWHSFGCLWTPQAFEFYLDRERIGTVPAHPTMDKCHYYLILNLAVGGKWPGAPGPDTPSPAALQIRYVKVWQRHSST